MHRFFIQNLAIKNGSVRMTDAKEVHHLRDVLRLKKGENVCLFNGRGEECIAVIQTINDKLVEFAVQSRRVTKMKRPFLVTLACAIPKKAKFEMIIEKCTELGVDEIIPMLTRRTEVHLKGERAEKKASRYRSVAVNAAKQCKRSTLPAVSGITSFKDALKHVDNQTLGLIPHIEGHRIALKDALAKRGKRNKILLFIGPEGDFTPEEIKLAKQAGCVPVSLGNTVLKVDTAAISAVAVTVMAEPAP